MSLIEEIDFGTPASKSETMVTLTIDGNEVTVPEGTSIMRAAMDAGHQIPKLCATDMVDAYGSCRLCLVEIEGRAGTPASCTTPVMPGLVVHTQSERLKKLRKGVMELYISDHPLDCLTCGANGDCELQDMAGAVGLRDVRYGYDGENHVFAKSRGCSNDNWMPKDESNPYFTYDPSKCIVCSRCVRACEEVQGTFALTISGRGFDSRVSPGMSESFLGSECVSCGACVQACPTATLTEKSVIEIGQPEHSVVTTCAYCGVGCTFKAEMRGEEVVRMVPYKDGKANRGHSCVKGRFAWGYTNHGERILNPMIRERIEDPWREVSWDEAFSFAAAKMRGIQKTYGRDAIGGITSSRCTNEETYLVQKLIRAGFGNNNVDTCARVCHSPTGYGLATTFGTSAGTQDFDSVEDTDVVLVIGANPASAHPVFASRLKKRLRQGAKLIVIDPRRTEMVESPHVKALHLPLMPGTNVAVMTALAHVIVTEGLVNEAFVRERCDWSEFEEWAAFVAQPKNSPEATAILTGVNPKDLREAARTYATGGNGAIYYGLGVTEHSQGSTTVIAIANLAMVTGNIGRPGVGVNPLRGQNNVQGSCDMGSFPHELPGYRHISGDAVRDQFEALWNVKLNPEPGLRIPNMFDAAVEGTFMGIYVQGEDILQSDPQHQARCGCTVRDGMRHRPRPLPQRDRELRPRLPARLELPREGRHLHQRRAPHPARAQGDDAEERHGRLGGHHRPCQGDGLRDELQPPIRDHGRDRGADADLRWRLLRQARRAWFGAVALQREGAGGYAGDAYQRLRTRQGQVRRHRICGHRRAYRPALSAAAHHGPHPQPVQCRRADAAHRERGLARRGSSRDPSARCRTARRARRRLGAAEEPRRRDHAACGDHRSRGARRRLHHLPSPGHPGQRHHDRLFGLGDQLPRIQGHGGRGLALERPVRLAEGL
ncbi:formylmethanofuran dehydrogenase subunit B/NAD-dependent dihydropyrimidine dehydrogenase PreA subunit [Bradyrhizobium japonicum]